jgi:orotate phosphoribosyltransferase
MTEQSATDRFAQRTLELLTAAGAILENDHFVYVSGDHGSGWINKDAIFPRVDNLATLCGWLAEITRDLQPEFICGPATGGLLVSTWTAHSLGAESVYAEHSPQILAGELRGRFCLRPEFRRLIAGRRVLVVDDIVNTGHSTRQTVKAARDAGATIVAAAALVSRGNVVAADMGVDEFRFLLEYRIPSTPAATCPLCRTGVPVNTDCAHGREFIAAERAVGE